MRIMKLRVVKSFIDEGVFHVRPDFGDGVVYPYLILSRASLEPIETPRVGQLLDPLSLGTPGKHAYTYWGITCSIAQNRGFGWLEPFRTLRKLIAQLKPEQVQPFFERVRELSYLKELTGEFPRDVTPYFTNL